MKVFTAAGLLALVFFTTQAPACSEHDTVSDIQDTLKSQNLKTVQATKAGKMVVVDGEVATPEEAVRVSRLIEGFRAVKGAGPIQNLVRVAAEGWTGLAAKIEREIASPEITVTVKGASFVLEGQADNEFIADRAVEITRSHLRAFKPEQTQAEFQITDMLRVKRLAKVKGTKKASR